MTSWREVLDGIEARLDDAERGEVIDEFVAPVVNEPLPAEHLARAEALIARGHELEAHLTARAQDVRAELRRLPRMQQGPRGVTARFQADA